MVEQFDNLLMSEVEAYITLQNFLEGVPREYFVSCQQIGSSSSGVVHSRPTAVQYLLESYAPNVAIHEAVANFRYVRQRPSEDEHAFHTPKRWMGHRELRTLDGLLEIACAVGGLCPTQEIPHLRNQELHLENRKPRAVPSVDSISTPRERSVSFSEKEYGGTCSPGQPPSHT